MNSIIKNKLFAAAVVTGPAIIIALCILGLGLAGYENGMNFFEFTDAIYGRYYHHILIVYIIVLSVGFPFSLHLFKSNKIKLIHMLSSRKTLGRDIIWGILAGISSYIFLFIDLHIVLKIPVQKTDDGSIIILDVVSLVFFSGFFKELYFRGIPYYLLKQNYGEWKSFLFGNVCFAVLDWPNYGLSFFLGLIWYLFFRKKGSLIIPVIGHGVCNLLGIAVRAGIVHF